MDRQIVSQIPILVGLKIPLEGIGISKALSSGPRRHITVLDILERSDKSEVPKM